MRRSGVCAGVMCGLILSAMHPLFAQDPQLPSMAGSYKATIASTSITPYEIRAARRSTLQRSAFRGNSALHRLPIRAMASISTRISGATSRAKTVVFAGRAA
jgi:hypothetical protein